MSSGQLYALRQEYHRRLIRDTSGEQAEHISHCLYRLLRSAA